MRNRGLAGLKVRRQHPFGRFVLDFYCPGLRLAIELDGSFHDAQAERDAERSGVLAAAGIRVIRLRNEEVLNDLPGVLARLRALANAPPLPGLGEGAGG